MIMVAEAERTNCYLTP